MNNRTRPLVYLAEGTNVTTFSSSSSSSNVVNTSTDSTSISSVEDEDDDLFFPLMQYLLSGQKKQRVKEFVDLIDSWSNDEFKVHLRIHRQTSDRLMAELEVSDFIPHYNFGQRPLSAKLSFYLFLWYISNTEPLRILSELFDISISSVFRVLRRVNRFFLSKLNTVIVWPQAQRVTEISRKFLLISGIPHVLGAIDCTHIKIIRPSAHSKDYFDRKKVFSLNLQAVVDSDKRFINIHCGEPGSLHDARVFRRSPLFESANRNQAVLFPFNTFLLGDSAYGSSSWLVPTFKDTGHLSRQQKIFNRMHSAGRVIVEQAFGQLKGRFRRIKFFTEYRELSFITNTTVAACILHNYCIDEHDDWNFQENEGTSDDDDDDDDLPHNPPLNQITVQRNRRNELMNELFPRRN